jgi:serine protease inhibitor ecotin
VSKTIKPQEASIDDAKCLSRIAIRSKAYWGYSAEFMDACAEELSVSRACIENSNFHYVVAVVGEEIVGFYALESLFKEMCDMK